jgi:hypothetical protein
MNAETFADWQRRQGHRVYRSQSSYWHEAGPRVLQAFPYHWQITPSEEEICNLMQEHGVLALRYSAPFESQQGMVSYHIVLHSPYTLEGLRSQARNGVKRGLKRFKTEQISFERLATEGWTLQQDTLDRQCRLKSMCQKEWECICRSAEGLPGFEAWAAVMDGELAAALIICRIDDVFNVPYALSHRKYLGNYVNNALFFATSREMLGRVGVREIFFTVQSLDAPPSVDDFKFRMGLMPKAVRQCVYFHPRLQLFVTPGLHHLTELMLQMDRSHPLLAKAEGMLRFNLAGKKSSVEQEWPECLATKREELLASLESRGSMDNVEGCQLPCLPKMAYGTVKVDPMPFFVRVKRSLAVPWNYHVKRWLKSLYYVRFEKKRGVQTVSNEDISPSLKNGDRVRVRSCEKIQATLNPFKELKGCAFLPEMWQYCGTEQRVLQVMERFLDERDYKVKKVKGLALLENVICRGTPVFGRCDRCCHFFWREEWLERVEDFAST